MHIDTISRPPPAVASTAQHRDADNVKRPELRAKQTEEKSRPPQAAQAVPQPVINSQGQPTGTLINIVG